MTCFRTWQCRLTAAVLCVASAAFSWWGMMAVHELGHVLHAAVSGGRVTAVVLHPLAISRTDVQPNPHPLWVVWGGPLWGSLLPLLAWGVARWRRWRYVWLVAFVAGFCLIANGAYIGAGVAMPVGDTDVMLRLGTPRWCLAAFGVATVSAGLRLWNGLGRHFGLTGEPVDRTATAAMVLLTVAIVGIELAL